MNNLSARKGQMELIGLIVIVVIVVTVMLLYMVFKINNPERSVKAGFVNKEIASNILISSMKVNVAECPFHTLDQLISDCASSVGRRIFCNSEPSCDVANRTLIKIVDTTLSDLGRDYYIKVDSTAIASEDGCSGREKIQASQALPLSLGSGVVAVSLDVCD